MPKPFFGEMMQDMEEGCYPAIITQVIALGHQADSKGTERSKVYIALEFKNGTTKPVNWFGINTWLSKNRPPFVGLYELITSAEKRELTNKELEAYDIFSLVGKSVSTTLVFNDKGYLNIAAVGPLNEGEEAPKPTREPIVIGVEDFQNAALMELVPDRVRAIIEASREYREVGSLSEGLNREKDGEEISVNDIPF